MVIVWDFGLENKRNTCLKGEAMNRKYALLSVAILFIMNSSMAESINKNTLEKLSFLTGCWKGNVEGALVLESWGQEEGNMMLGTSKTIVENKVVSFEFLKISVENNEVIYTPYVEGEKNVSFKLVTSQN